MTQAHTRQEQTPQEKNDRQTWMAVLATAPEGLLGEKVSSLGPLPVYQWLRPPEIGLVMVRGRADGSGAPFNVGEMPITRCVLHIEDPHCPEGVAGFGYVAGRSRQHAEWAAICDALLQIPAWQERIWQAVVQPLQAEAQQRRQQQQQQTAATQVNFFTLVRGE